jgi:hypothetical protein
MRENGRGTAFGFALAGVTVVAAAGSAVADDAMKVRPGFGYNIEFMSGTGAEALLPPAASKHGVMIVRPGFGYTIDFMTGPAAEALFPPGWAKQRALTKPPLG